MPKLAWIMLAILIIVAATLSAAEVEVPASEVMAKIENGQPVDYIDVRIAGDLNLSTVSSPDIRSSISIINSTIINATLDGKTFEKDLLFWGTSISNASLNRTRFLGMADFSSATFGQASFEQAEFSQPVFFDGAKFLDDATFTDCRFLKDASLNEVHFIGHADFNYTIFESYAYFSGAQFYEDAYFSSSDFLEPLDFSMANFTAIADFSETQFGAAIFDSSRFMGIARFGLTKFNGLSSFGQAIFAEEANFILARFGEAAYFSGAHFKEKALFGLAKFEDVASFQNAAFESELNLKASQIYTFLLQKANFGMNSKLILNDADFARFKTTWKEIEDHIVYDPGVYLALVDNYRRLGWHNDEDDCYYAYRSLDQAGKGWGWSKAIDALAWISCGYGVRPSYAMAWSIITILIFAVIFWWGDGIRRSARPLQGTLELDSVPERVFFRNALFFSTMIFLSQGPIDFLPIGRNRYYVIIEGIVGWLLLALFLVTLGRVMIR